MNLSLFQKPSRYINGEYNSTRRKTVASRGEVTFALSFPDIYEIGMSHLGLRILYDIINLIPYASAERFFSPWTDLEEYLRRNGAPLSSLESNIPLNEFDIAGFSLQYELSYTTVLNMLYLGGIPIRSEERLNSKKNLPIVIAGGPCTVNPMPMSPFIDAFLIGDGENAVVEIADTVRRWKLSGDGSREFALREISKLKGFYVPSVHGAEYKIARQFIVDLDCAPYPVKPVVPYTTIVHDRVNVEVARGCAMGCRFCQAGIIYRPLRERSPDRVLQIAEESIKNTGYGEVSFTSLSAGDYTHLLSTVSRFNRKFGNKKIALSLPSLRVASVNREILKEIRTVRKTGFTMAPEAATQRLRDAINKNFSEEDYENALKALFEEGWLNLKLYFMIGLPTERDEDIEAVKDMAMQALRIAKKNTGRFVNISITVSPFVPKSHTPFQWHGQIGLDEMKRKTGYLRDMLGSKKLKYKGHNEETSMLEAVFARGDEKLSLLIEEAWKSGCRLDAWSELFDFNRWVDAMHKTGVNGFSYAQRCYEKNERLPWDNVDTGIKTDFLYKEYEKAMSGERTPDCGKVCAGCGLKCPKDSNKLQVTDNMEDSDRLPPHPPLAKGGSKGDYSSLATCYSSLIRVRIQFSKAGMLQYISHLELVSAVIRGLRRAQVPFDFSKGFHPAPRVSFGPPLSVGVAGEKEYFDMEVFAPFDIEFYNKALNNVLPEGIRISKIAVIPLDEPALSNFIKRYEYVVRSNGRELTGERLNNKNIVVHRDGKNIDMYPHIEGFKILDDAGGGRPSFKLTLKDDDNMKIRLREITEAVFGVDMRELNITRTAVYGWKGEWVEPL